MAEVAGLALSVLGTVGILGQIFDGCIKGYRVFSSASHLGKDSERLVCKVKIEEMRLWVWGREWGIVEGKFEAQLAMGIWGNEGLKDLATEILTQLFQTIMDCNKLQGRYGLREAAPGSVDKEAYKKSVDLFSLATEAKPQEPPTRSLKDELKLRARWVIADKEKFGTFLDDLQYFNDRLERLFPPARLATHDRMVTNELLQTAQRDRTQLDYLEAASVGKYPRLNAFAHLKQLRINLDAMEPSRQILSSSQLKIPRQRLILEPDDEQKMSSRVRGVYHKPLAELRGDASYEPVPVIIDWIYYDEIVDMDARLHLYQRIDNLARMLHSGSSRHPDLNTLDCVGYVDDTAAQRYGIIHLVPSSQPPTPNGATPDVKDICPPFKTLSAILDDPGKRTPDLDVRFHLAHKLAVALWSFHSLDWLHKSFCSLNILFFEAPNGSPSTAASTTPSRTPSPRPPLARAASSRTSEQHDLRAPAILGFDSSRPDGLVEMTYNARLTAPEEIYRHPASLGADRRPYCKEFDVYALGLVLLELGLWKSVRVIHKPRYAPREFRDKVLLGLVPALGSKTGRRYRAIVEACLLYEEGGKEDRTPHQMMEWVVVSLEALRV
jgi:hypothetical protein